MVLLHGHFLRIQRSYYNSLVGVASVIISFINHFLYIRVFGHFHTNQYMEQDHHPLLGRYQYSHNPILMPIQIPNWVLFHPKSVEWCGSVGSGIPDHYSPFRWPFQYNIRRQPFRVGNATELSSLLLCVDLLEDEFEDVRYQPRRALEKFHSRSNNIQSHWKWFQTIGK